MNEIEIRKKLSKLKQVIPTQESSMRMKQIVFGKIAQKSPMAFSFYNHAALYAGMSTLIAIIGMFSFFLFQNTIRSFVFATRIAMTNNHYEKTKLTFEEAEGQLHTNSSFQTIMMTTTTTNEYISHLHLQGEKGKYTAEQCKGLYQAYASYLATLNMRLLQKKQKEYAAIISSYQEQAESRFSFYTAPL